MTFTRTRVGLQLVVCLGLCQTLARAQEERFDVVIAGGRVVDPESGLDVVRNVGIRGGIIAAITEKSLAGKEVLDASGLVVAPGFIDLHSHAQTLAGHRMQAFDGVTTSLELETGMLPIGLAYQAAARERRPLNYGYSSSWSVARSIALAGLKSDARSCPCGKTLIQSSGPALSPRRNHAASSAWSRRGCARAASA